MHHRLGLVILLGVGLLLSALTVLAGPALQDTDQRPAAIIRFEADLDAITLPDTEAGTQDITLTWQTANLQADHRLALDVYHLDSWASLLDEDDDDDTLPANGSRTLAVEHPQNFSAPTYRLSILDAQDTVLDERVVVIPYALPEDEDVTPTIQRFESEVERVLSSELGEGVPSVLVSWEVADRLPASNLIFEQLLPDGATRLVELPRRILWVPSSGQGALAPILPPDGADVRLRLRVVDASSEEVYDEVEMTVTVEEVAGPAPASPLPPTISQPPANIEIESFAATPAEIDPGDEVALRWSVNGAQSIRIVRLSESGGVFLETIGDALPDSGSLSFAVPGEYTEEIPFQLIASTGVTRQSQTVTVTIRCPYTDTLSDKCPQTRTEIPAAYQPFQNGYMLWRSDTSQILVLYNNGTFRIYPDTYTEGETVTIDDTPPSGMIAPERGFGKVWVNQSGVRDQLGWATGAEQGYTATLEIVPVPSRPAMLYLTLPDGSYVVVGPNSWAFGE